MLEAACSREFVVARVEARTQAGALVLTSRVDLVDAGGRGRGGHLEEGRE